MRNSAETFELAQPGEIETAMVLPTPERIREQLHRIIRSKTFQRAKRLRSLLEYVVDGALHGNLSGGQSQTARELFGKSDDFDPSLDPVIRVQFGRLRRALTNYYTDEGQRDPVLIDIPKRRYAPVFEASKPGSITAAGSPPVEEQKSPANGHSSSSERPLIAVLPFTNLTSDPAHDAFCFGLTEEIAHGLASVASIDVVASGSTSQFRHEAVDVREAGRELGVPLILEGSVRMEDGHTRVIAQLARSEDGVAVWSDSFDDDMNGSLNTQKTIAQKVMENLPLSGYEA